MLVQCNDHHLVSSKTGFYDTTPQDGVVVSKLENCQLSKTAHCKCVSKFTDVQIGKKLLVVYPIIKICISIYIAIP